MNVITYTETLHKLWPCEALGALEHWISIMSSVQEFKDLLHVINILLSLLPHLLCIIYLTSSDKQQWETYRIQLSTATMNVEYRHPILTEEGVGQVNGLGGERCVETSSTRWDYR